MSGDATRGPTAGLILIGNEILSGRTRDANLPYLAGELSALGIRMVEVRVIPDIEETIAATVNEVRVAVDYLFTTGGIGPTHDDITSLSLAKAFGVPWVVDPVARQLLLDHYGPEKLNAARLRMATVPQGATLIDNPISLAPGFQIGNVFVLAGVPAIAQAMFQSLKHRLSGGPPLLSASVTAYVGEGVIAEGLGRIQAGYPQLDLGSYPFQQEGRFGTHLVIRGTDAAALEAARLAVEQLVEGLGEPIRIEG